MAFSVTEEEQVWEDMIGDEGGEVGHSHDVGHGDTMCYLGAVLTKVTVRFRKINLDATYRVEFEERAVVLSWQCGMGIISVQTRIVKVRRETAVRQEKNLWVLERVTPKFLPEMTRDGKWYQQQKPGPQGRPRVEPSKIKLTAATLGGEFRPTS